jgi:hypothetical protein
MKFEVIDNVDLEEWQAVADQCQYTTFFHTHFWMDIITSTFPSLENATIGWILEDARKVVLPLVKTRVGPAGMFYRYQSMWPGVYGGILCNGKVSRHELDLLYRSLRSLLAAGGYIFGNPFAKQEPSDIFKTEKVVTHIVDLREGVDAVWRKMESAFRRRVRRAREKGVTVASATSLTDYQEYYQIYKDSQRRWGDRATSSYPYQLFENIQKAAMKNSESIKLWLARVNGLLGAGALVFYHGRHAVSWHAATSEAAYPASPANALQMAIIEDAGERGLAWYDLNPSGGYSGTARFKQAMGATDWPFKKAILKPGILWKMYRGTAATKFKWKGRRS